MAALAQLQATFNELETQLRQVSQEQAATKAGTEAWWELQRAIGDLRPRALVAERALLQAQNDAGLPGRQERENRLYFISREMKPPAQPPHPRDIRKHPHPLERGDPSWS